MFVRLLYFSTFALDYAKTTTNYILPNGILPVHSCCNNR